MMRMARLMAVAVILGYGWTLLTGSVPHVASGFWLPGPDMTEARTGGAAVLLEDGRTLLFGGTTSTGGATNAVEVFDAASGSWSDLGTVMLDARSGHSATLLKDGRVLLAGGETSSGPLASLEVFDPQTGSFNFAGTLLMRRKDHGAALLGDGRVLIVGGSTGQMLLNSSEIFDPETSTVTPEPAMPFPRAGHSVTALLDGKVLVAGGRMDQQDLASTLLYDPAVGGFVSGPSLLQARSGHTAVRLPHNNSVLIAGGTSAGVALSSAELYVPWMNRVTATAAMALARRGAASSGVAQEGVAAVAGGSGLASSEFYGFATVQADKDDYSPGETVLVRGQGWQPGETVTLRLQEVPATHGESQMSTVADASGNIFHAVYDVEPHDIGIRFYLTASGSHSQAQTSFTDGNLASSIVFNISPASVAPGGMLSFTATATCQNGVSPADACAANGFVAGGSVPNGYLVIIEMATSPGFSPAVTSITGPAIGGSFSGMIAAPSTSGTYYFRARHPLQPIAPHQWLEAISNSVMVTVTAPPADGVAPETFITGNPASPSSSASASFSFTGADNVTPSAELTFQCSLDGAAFSACSSPQSYLSLADGAHSFQVRAQDAAGNLDPTPASFSWSIDTSAPLITPDVSGTLGLNGWYVSDVVVSWSVSDPGSGISSSTGCGASTLSSDTTGSTLTCSATNAAGLSSSASVSIKLDKTAPSSQLAVIAGTPGSNGWYVSDVTVHTDGSDSISGPVTCTTDQIVSAEGTTVLNGSCANDAGLTTDAASLSVMLDKSGPSASLTVIAGTSGSNGWYVSDVTVHTDGSDGQGAVTCTTDQIVSTEGTTVVNGSCTNEAGLTTDAASLSVMVDKSGPSASLTVTAGTPGSNGWYVSDVTVHTDGSDSQGAVTCTTDRIVSTEGTTVVNGSCTNDAGLTTDAASLSVMLDKTAPTNVSGQAARTPDSNGWYNHPVAVNFSGQDAVSGVAGCSSATYSGPDGAAANVSGSCTDLAGNSASASFALMYDGTAPTLKPVVSPNPVVLNGSATATANATDNLSGVATASCSVVNTSSEGPQTVSCTATDVAGNTASASATYSVVASSGFMPAGTLCLGEPGHQVLDPLSATGTGVFRRGQLVRVRFRVCDANGVSVGPTPVVESFSLVQVIGNPTSRRGNGGRRPPQDTTFQWLAGQQLWTLNLVTNNLGSGATYVYRIHLVDGSDIYFQFTLK